MRRFKGTVLGGLAAVVLWISQPASAAIFMKFEGIPGNTTAAGHSEWIALESAQLNNQAVVPGGSILSAAVSSVSQRAPGVLSAVVRKTTAASPWKQAADQRRSFPSVLLDVPGSGGQAYMRYELQNVQITSYQLGAGGGFPTETVSFNYGRVRYIPPAGSSIDPNEPTLVAAAAPKGAIAKVAPPTIIRVTPSPAQASPGVTVHFLVEATGDCKRARIVWGDPHEAVNAQPPAEYAIVSLKAQAPAHAYSKAGTYTVTAYGLNDPMAKLPAPPPPGENACFGHASATVLVKQMPMPGPAVPK